MKTKYAAAVVLFIALVMGVAAGFYFSHKRGYDKGREDANRQRLIQTCVFLGTAQYNDLVGDLDAAQVARTRLMFSAAMQLDGMLQSGELSEEQASEVRGVVQAVAEAYWRQPSIADFIMAKDTPRDWLTDFQQFIERHPKQLVSTDFLRRLDQEDHVTFESWNGNLKHVDSDQVLHFKKNSKVIMVDMGLGVTQYKGTYEIWPNDRIMVFLDKYPKEWPPMVLSADGEDLLVHRVDGHTSWLPKDHPDVDDPDGHTSGYWPFRAKIKNETE